MHHASYGWTSRHTSVTPQNACMPPWYDRRHARILKIEQAKSPGHNVGDPPSLWVTHFPPSSRLFVPRWVKFSPERPALPTSKLSPPFLRSAISGNVVSKSITKNITAQHSWTPTPWLALSQPCPLLATTFSCFSLELEPPPNWSSQFSKKNLCGLQGSIMCLRGREGGDNLGTKWHLCSYFS